MGKVERIFTVLGAFFANQKNRVGFIIMAASFIPLGLMSLYDELRYAIGYKHTSIFAQADDRFADLLEAAMSYKSVTSELVGSGQIAGWSKLYLHYLTVTATYYGIPLTHYNMPPFGALFHIAVAELLVAFDPTTALWASIALYVVLAVFASWLLRRFFDVSKMDQVAVGFVFLLSYPAFYMITRGNLLAGYTCIFLAIYTLTALKGQYRWWGLICLSIAINIRPNTMVFGLLELVVVNNRCERTILGVVLFAVLLAIVSRLIVQTVDPGFTIENFMKALRVYNWAYAEGSMGTDWNCSLYGTTRVLRDTLGLQPTYDESWYFVVRMIGALSVLATLYLAMARRLTMVTATFLATALSALFTPVFAFYHMLEFSVPLVVVVAAKGKATEISRDKVLVFATSLFCLCPFDARRTIYPLFIFAAMVTLMVRVYRQEPGSIPK